MTIRHPGNICEWQPTSSNADQDKKFISKTAIVSHMFNEQKRVQLSVFHQKHLLLQICGCRSVGNVRPIISNVATLKTC